MLPTLHQGCPGLVPQWFAESRWVMARTPGKQKALVPMGPVCAGLTLEGQHGQLPKGREARKLQN